MQNKFIEKLEAIATKLGLSKEKFEDVKDNQGNIIRIDNFVVGGKAQLISTDGTLVDLTDGEYTLEDGRSFTIQTGVITTISNDVKDDTATPTEKVQPVAQATDAPAADAAPAATNDNTVTDSGSTTSDSSDVEDRLTNLETAVEQILTYIQAMTDSTKEFKSVKKQLEAKINELEKTPAGTPIQVKASKVEGPKPSIKTVKGTNMTEANRGMWNKEEDYANKYEEYLKLRKTIKK